MIKDVKAIAPVVVMSLLMVVVVISVVGFSGWYDSFSSELFVELESDSNVNSFVDGIESINSNGLYVKAGDDMKISKVEINGIDCNVNGSYSGLSNIDVSLCLSQVIGSVADVVIVTDSGVINKELYLDPKVLSGAVPTSTEIISLTLDILLFQSNYSDLIVSDITIGGNSVVNYPTTLNYSLATTAVNNYDTYSCNNLVSVDGDWNYGIYTISDLGFDFPFYDKLIYSGTDFYVDTNGRISTEDNKPDNYVSGFDNEFQNEMDIASSWADLDLSSGGIYVCPNQGTSPNKYAVIKFVGGTYWYDNKMDNEVVLRENGEINFNYGGLVDTPWMDVNVGLSDGKGLNNIEVIENESSLANYTKTYSTNPLNPLLNVKSGVYNIDLDSLGVLDLTNTELEFRIVTNKGDFTKNLNVGSLFDSCSLDGINKDHSRSYTFFNSPSPVYPSLCETQTRTCKNGNFDGNNLYAFSSCSISGYPSSAIFSSTWNTSKFGISSNTQIKLPLKESGSYSFEVNWGDGNTSFISEWDQSESIHNYASPGVYNINISGSVDGFGFIIDKNEWTNDADDGDKLLDISQWGILKLGNDGSYFYGAENLKISAIDSPDLSETTNLANTFNYAQSFNSSINHWNVSNIENMSQMFSGADIFDRDLNTWDISSVIDMETMFGASGEGSPTFNGDISTWVTSKVKNMKGMFSDNSKFNQDLDKWDTSSVTNMEAMFYNTNVFNGNISTWNTSSVTNMNYMLKNADGFNQPINSWNTSLVTSMDGMFSDSLLFNQPLNEWDVSLVTDMSSMFSRTGAFNQDLDKWDTGSVTNMDQLFAWTVAFNGNISNWNTSNVTSMSGTFWKSDVFNQPLNEWDVSKVTRMWQIFSYTKLFNQDLDKWDVSSVDDADYMFSSSEAFNGDISTWKLSSLTDFTGMFYNSEAFNRDISSWNVSHVTRMSSMFKQTLAFNQDISGWDVSSVTAHTEFDASSNAGWTSDEKPTFP